MAGDDTFIKITNRDIWNKLELIEQRTAEGHESIILHQKETNGKVKTNRWIATTALSLIISGFLVYVGVKGYA